MAGEVKGKIYEAVTRVALEMAVTGNRNSMQVLFHEQPEWVDIEADLAVGRSLQDVDTLILVTHATSEKLWEKKFWRNFGELFQWKVQGPVPVRCMEVIFDAVIKPELKRVATAMLDATIDLSEHVWGRCLIQYVSEHLGAFGKSDTARYQHVLALCSKSDELHDPVFLKALGSFSQALRPLLRVRQSHMEVWSILRRLDVRNKSVPEARTTYVRNGIAKLMLLPPKCRDHAYVSCVTGESLPDDVVPSTAVALGLVTEGIVGCELVDQEILNVVSLLGKDRCEYLINTLPERMHFYAAGLRATDNIPIYCQYVADQQAVLKTRRGMKEAILKCFDDPCSLLVGYALTANHPPEHWLFVFCMTIEKALAGKVLAYGLSNLAAETGVREIGSMGGVIISPLINREQLPGQRILDAVCAVFAKKIGMLDAATLASEEFQCAMRAMLIQRQMYVLSTYRMYDPLLDLIVNAVHNAGYKSRRVHQATFLREFSGASAATSTFLAVGDHVLIYWQTATDAGRVHKVKELSARFRSTRVKWTGKTFEERPEAKTILLVVDGEWRRNDFETLMRSGVDGVFYADEMDKLVTAIGGKRRIHVPPEEDALPMAAESDKPVKIKRKRA